MQFKIYELKVPRATYKLKIIRAVQSSSSRKYTKLQETKSTGSFLLRRRRRSRRCRRCHRPWAPGGWGTDRRGSS